MHIYTPRVPNLWDRITKFIEPPGPVELGRSKSSALPMRDFGSEEGDYTWDDWEEEVKRDYRVRYFLGRELPRWWQRTFVRPVSEFFYWLRSYVVPSRRYHMLDLRQPKANKSTDVYRWGWIDPVNQVLYANFNILKAHYESGGRDYKKWWDEQDHEGDGEPWKTSLAEMEDLYFYWTVRRPLRQSRIDDMFQSAKVFPRRSQAYEVAMDAWMSENKSFEREEDEALVRLMTIRRSLWS